MPWVDFIHDVSEPLARSVGSLDGLTHLELIGLHEVLTLQDCYLHFGALGALRSLALDLQSRECRTQDTWPPVPTCSWVCRS